MASKAYLTRKVCKMLQPRAWKAVRGGASGGGRAGTTSVQCPANSPWLVEEVRAHQVVHRIVILVLKVALSRVGGQQGTILCAHRQRAVG